MGLEVFSVSKVFRNLCPRNCFSTCAILSHVENGKLVRVSGDPAHGFTRGNLCAKGYAYVERVYSPERILHPLRQFPRGSGNWCPITWDEALEVIARKILELKGRYHSFLPVYSEPASAPAAYPFRLMTPHSQTGNNSQFLNLPWLAWGTGEPCLRINPLAAKRFGLNSGDLVRVYNQQGEIVLPVKLSATIGEDTLICFQGWHDSGEHDLNDLVNGSPTDMGSKGTGRSATAIHDTFVNLCPA
jgi:anaerobic selenocysteine-containing dehydrogenase